MTFDPVQPPHRPRDTRQDVTSAAVRVEREITMLEALIVVVPTAVCLLSAALLVARARRTASRGPAPAAEAARMWPRSSRPGCWPPAG